MQSEIDMFMSEWEQLVEEAKLQVKKLMLKCFYSFVRCKPTLLKLLTMLARFQLYFHWMVDHDNIVLVLIQTCTNFRK